MIVISDPGELNLSGSAVSIGMFDGVHRGHRRVLRNLRDQGSVCRFPPFSSRLILTRLPRCVLSRAHRSYPRLMVAWIC